MIIVLQFYYVQLEKEMNAQKFSSILCHHWFHLPAPLPPTPTQNASLSNDVVRNRVCLITFRPDPISIEVKDSH